MNPERTFANPVAHLTGICNTLPQNSRYLVGLVGLPGAGKTTIATRIATEVNAMLRNISPPDHSSLSSFVMKCPPEWEVDQGRMVSLGMDGFHLTRAELRQFPDPEMAFRRRGAPWTFDAHGMAERLRRVREAVGKDDVAWPTFEHSVGDPVREGSWVPAKAKIVLVEGLYLLYRKDGWEEIGPLFDETWYLDTPFPIAMERLARRHREAWSISEAEAEARIAANDRLNAEIVEQTRPLADYIVI